MSDRMFERAVLDWLEDGSDRTPRPAIDAVLLAIKTTPQERGLRLPRRITLMPTYMRLAAGIAIVAVLGGGALLLTNRAPDIGTNPSPSPARSSSPTAVAPTATSGGGAYSTIPGWIVFEWAGKAPDGSTPANVDYPPSIWLVHTDGSGLHELAPGIPSNGKLNPDISPDGTKVAFSTNELPAQIWEVDIEGGAPRLLSKDCSGLEAECMEIAPAYSPDGRSIAFVRARTGQMDVLGIRDLVTNAVTLLESTRSSSPDLWLAAPTWSPDGTQLAYHQVHYDAAQDEVTDAQIYIASTDDTDAHQLPLPPGVPYGDADWSPDGSRIAFSSYPIHEFNTNKARVMTARPDGTDLKTFDEDGAPTWTPDGLHIMFWGPTTFYMMDPDGRNKHQVNQLGLLNFGVTNGYGYYGFLQPTT
jgi:TolB protein